MKKIILVLSVILSMNGITPIFAEEVNPITSDSAIETYNEKLEWRFKIINGKWYKRLWNVRLNRWEGDWIRC